MARGARYTLAGWVMKNVRSADGWDDEIRTPRMSPLLIIHLHTFLTSEMHSYSLNERCDVHRATGGLPVPRAASEYGGIMSEDRSYYLISYRDGLLCARSNIGMCAAITGLLVRFDEKISAHLDEIFI